MSRRTLKEQIDRQEAVDKMTDEEIVELLTLPNSIDFWIFGHSELLWSIINWNWFCIWCGRSHFRWNDRKCYDEYILKQEVKSDIKVG